LTIKLDKLNSDFNQEIINEIVLWKVDRYSLFDYFWSSRKKVWSRACIW